MHASLRKWKIGDRFLGDGDLRILAIILRGGGALPASMIAKDYGSTYPYERLPVLVEGGFLMHEAGGFRLTEKGMIAGVRGCLLIDEFRKMNSSIRWICGIELVRTTENSSVESLSSSLGSLILRKSVFMKLLSYGWTA